MFAASVILHAPLAIERLVSIARSDQTLPRPLVTHLGGGQLRSYRCLIPRGLRHDRRKTPYRFGKDLKLVACEVKRNGTDRHVQLAAVAQDQLHRPIDL